MVCKVYQIQFSVASIEVLLTSPISPETMQITDRYRSFMENIGKPTYHIDLEWKEFSEKPVKRPQLIFDPGEIWQMYRDESLWYAAFSYQDKLAPFEKRDRLEANAAWNQIRLWESRSRPDWRSLLNSGVGELMIRTAILFTKGLVFHASGLDDNGKGIVFIGHSGAGKSTQVQMWQEESGVVAMNDDRIAVRIGEEGPMCYGTPWGGTANIAKNHAAPLKAMIILEQAPENSIQLYANEKVPVELMARTFLPYWDKGLMQLAMENLERIIQQVPVYLLRCRAEKSVIPLVRSVI